MDFTFEWNEEKARLNISRHRIDFDEAKSTFYDPLLLTFPDPQHSDLEERLISLGLSDRGRVLLVSHTERGRNIRIISARKASASERREYEDIS